MAHRALPIAVALCLSLVACADATPPPAPELAAPAPAPSTRPSATPALDHQALVARGEYLVRIAGCNDCHTPGYAAAGGEVPEESWLTGSSEGFLGPWGTTYPTNLRLRVASMEEEAWMAYSATLRARPLMPDFAVRAMTEDDRRALYRFIRSLGPAGDPAPLALPPGQVPSAPYLALVLPEAVVPEAPATP